MAREVIEHLAIRPDGVYLDATAGLGGHTLEIARRLETGVVIANDRDPESLEMARKNTAELAARIHYRHGSFSELRKAVPEKIDGLLADLGVSRYQLTEPERGFSFQSDGPLDMRMDQTTGMTAADLVNHTAEKALADLIFQLGEERRARKIARAIVRARPIRSTLHLAGVVERAVPRTGRLHPATKTFMALRMAVNDEQGELDRLLETGPDAPQTRRPHGGHLLHVARGPEGQAGISRTGSAGAGRTPDEASPGAVRGRDSREPGVAQRQAAGAGDGVERLRENGDAGNILQTL